MPPRDLPEALMSIGHADDLGPERSHEVAQDLAIVVVILDDEHGATTQRIGLHGPTSLH
jgi:hypothetical protein